MDGKLAVQAIVKFAAGVLLVALLLFVPAGTLYYRNAWLLMSVLFIPMFLAGLVMLWKSPELLRKRLNMREKEAEQQDVVKFSGLMFLLGFVIAGLDHRFKWLPMPGWLSVAAAVVLLLSYAAFAEVLRENAYLSRTIEVQKDQKVIDTGLYGIVRHPMYSATLLLFLAMPLVLGSLLSFAVFLMYPAIITKRIRNEEQVLEAGLEGYSEYKKRVKYRLIPFIW